MRKIIYLYNNFHLNKISISFMIISSFLILYSIYSSIELNLNSIDDLRNYEGIKQIFINDTYTILELIISMFVVILSFMELYNNSHLFDVILIAKNKKYKVLFSKIISYLMIIVTYVTIVIFLSMMIAIIEFEDNTLFFDMLKIYGYTLMISIFTLFISLILLNVFRNYFASFVLLLGIILKRVILEMNSYNISKFIPYLNINKNISISISYIQIILYTIILTTLSIYIYKKKDIKT